MLNAIMYLIIFITTNVFIIYIFVTTFLLLCLFAEVIVSEPLPLFVYLNLIALASALLMSRYNKYLNYKIRFFSFICFFVLALVLFLVPWNSRTPFMRSINAIKPGMAEEKMLETLKTENFSLYTDVNVLINKSTVIKNYTFRHSSDPAFNADCGLIEVVNGRVVKSIFLYD